MVDQDPLGQKMSGVLGLRLALRATFRYYLGGRLTNDLMVAPRMCVAVRSLNSEFLDLAGQQL